MLYKRVIAVLLTVAVVLCTLVFSAAAENETWKVSVLVNGCGVVLTGGEEYDDEFVDNLAVGTELTLTAEPDDENYDFLYWLDRDSSRIISWDEEITVEIASFVRYDAVFVESGSYLESQDLHTVIYLTSGDNVIFQRNVLLEDTSYYSDVPTTGMFVSGKTFIGWDKTADEVAAAKGCVVVHPLYQTDAFFDITWTVNGVTNTQRVKYQNQFTVIAPTKQDGDDFSYWVALAQDVNSEDEIASFYATYKFVVTGDVVLEAVYGEPYPDDIGIAARISGDFPSQEEHSVTVFAEHSVTEDYTVQQHGMLLTYDLAIGSFDNTFRIDQIDPNDDNPPIKKMTSKDKTRFGSYRINVTNWDPTESNGILYYPRVFARAYVIAKDANGNSYTFYSQIYCVDYQYQTGSGGGTNVDDPFG